MVVKHRHLKNILFALLILAIVLFAIFPFVQMVSTSLKYSWDWGNPSLMPTKVNPDAYVELLGMGQSVQDLPESVRILLEETPNLTRAQKNAIIEKYQDSGDVFPFGKYFLNSLLFAACSAFLSLLIAILGAYSFSRMEYTGRKAIQRGVLFVYMFGGILLLIPLYKVSVALGLAGTQGGTVFSILIIYVVQTLPVCLYMLGNYFRTIPFSIEEAAFIEGLSHFQTIQKIIIPLSLSAIATVYIYAFMIAWNEYLFASVFLKSYTDIYTLSIGLRTLFYSKNAIWDRIMAASMLTALPVVFLFLLIQKQLTGGLTAGGVKG
ncbi:MAG: carbohydrate ABC transporter permease [Spirochaetales bacterium]|nr:carbohydrate ABC transporter permease [Spirochaetales bacterium]